MIMKDAPTNFNAGIPKGPNEKKKKKGELAEIYILRLGLAREKNCARGNFCQD